MFALANGATDGSPQQTRTQTFGGSFNENNQDTPTLNREEGKRRHE